MKQNLLYMQRHPVREFLNLLDLFSQEDLETMGISSDDLHHLKQSIDLSYFDLLKDVYDDNTAQSIDQAQNLCIQAFSILEREHVFLFNKNETFIKKLIENPDAISSVNESTIPTLQFLFGIQEEQIDQSYKVAITLYQNKSYEDALAVLTLLTQISPFYSNIWYAKGMIAQKLNYLEIAVHAYDIAVELNPELLVAYVHLIKCCLQLGELDKAKCMIEFLQSKKGDIQYTEEIRLSVEQLTTKLINHR